MSSKKYLTLGVSLKKGNEIVMCNISIRNEYAIAVFSKKGLAKQLYEIDLKQGEKVFFDKKDNALIRNYPNKTKEEIVEIIKNDLKKAGATAVEVNKNGFRKI